MSPETINAAQIDVLKIGIDIHASEYVFVCQEDQSALKSPQRKQPKVRPCASSGGRIPGARLSEGAWGNPGELFAGEFRCRLFEREA